MAILKNYPDIISSKQLSLIIEQLRKCICKVYNDGPKHFISTGFFCFIPYNNKKLPVLIVNNHLIDENYIKNNGVITLTSNENEKKIKINIKDNRIIYTNEEYDITIIEINPETDSIYNYLELDQHLFENEKLFMDRSIYTIQCDKRVSFGILKEINDYEIKHLCCTEMSSGGCPIMDLSRGTIIGIHVGRTKSKNYNIGTFLKYPIKNFIDKFKDYINSKEKPISQTYSVINPQIQSTDFEDKYKKIKNELELEKCKNKILEEKIIQLQKLLDKYSKNNIILDNGNSNELSEEEKKNLKKLKKEILENEKKNRNFKKEIKSEKEKNNKINNILENMCIYGNIVKIEIEEEKQKNPDHFIPIEEALKEEKNDQELFALALIANELKKIGVEVVIEKDDNKNEEDEDEEELTCFNFLFNGLNNKIKKYDLHFDFGDKRNKELLKNQKEYNSFKEKLKLKLSKEYKISVDKIIITFPQRGSLHVQLIFQSEEFNNLGLEEFRNRFNNDPEYNELNSLKEIHSGLLIDHCKLSKKLLDPEGNRIDGWGIDEERGNKEYFPPINWIGIGIKVFDKYDNGDNEWIGMYNTEGEWCVAYHGLCRYKKSDEVKRITGIIVKGDLLRPGERQAYEEDDDLNHPGNKVGRGVYVTPKIEIAKRYAGKSEINGVEYYTALMVRVKPTAIRCSEDEKDYWVLESDEIRPYRILYKKVNN